jgi:hypothetical protein
MPFLYLFLRATLAQLKINYITQNIYKEYENIRQNTFFKISKMV